MLLFVTDACLIGSYSCTFHSAHDVITVFKGVINIYHWGGGGVSLVPSRPRRFRL